MKGGLGGGTDDKTLIFVPVGDADVRLDRCLLYLLQPVGSFEDVGGLAQALLHIPNICTDGDHQIAAGVLYPDGIRLVVDNRRAFLQSLLGFEDGREQFIVHFDQLKCLAGDFS